MNRYSWTAILLYCFTATLVACDDETPPVADTQPVTDIGPGTDTSTDGAVPDKLVPDQLIPDQLIPDAPLPTCTDNKQNGSETDIDCGGGTCP